MITVFTPAYNRAYLLDRLYQSLERQTCKQFEWLVVDDGSTDETAAYFADMVTRQTPFPVIYIRQENGGKHRAINRGVQAARGELFFIVDSDDYLTDDAIEKLSVWADTLDETHKWAGISGMRGYSNGEYIGEATTCKNKYVDAKNTERDKRHLRGDKAEAYFTEILRRYPFPVFDGETFITEEVVWNRIARDGYYIRWYSDIIYICEYLDGGLTKSGDVKYKRNPQGVLYWTKQQLEIFPRNIRKKLAAIYRYYVAADGRKSIGQIAGISSWMCRLAVLAGTLYSGGKDESKNIDNSTHI